MSGYSFQASRKQVPGTWIVIRGHNPSMAGSNTVEIIGTQGGTYPWATTEETLHVSSNNSNDTFAGTGARTVLVDGLDSSFNIVQEIVQMNGTGNATTTNTFFRVNALTVLTAGTGERNAGQIRATNTTSGQILATILTNEGLKHDAVYTVPAGYALYINTLELNSIKISGGGNPLVKFDGEIINRGQSNPVWYQLFEKRMDTAVTDTIEIFNPNWSRMPEKHDLQMVAASDLANTESYARVYGLLIKESNGD